MAADLNMMALSEINLVSMRLPLLIAIASSLVNLLLIEGRRDNFHANTQHHQSQNCQQPRQYFGNQQQYESHRQQSYFGHQQHQPVRQSHFDQQQQQPRHSNFGQQQSFRQGSDQPLVIDNRQYL